MKEELFYVKAKEMIKNGNSENWILGYYTKKQVNDFIRDVIVPLDAHNPFILIDAQTLCRCTGKRDCMSALLFENDIVRLKKDDELYIIKYNDFYSSWVLVSYDMPDIPLFTFSNDIISNGRNLEKLGNVYDTLNLINIKNINSLKNNMQKYILTTIGHDNKYIPLEDYLEIEAQQNGFDSYTDLKENGCFISILNEVEILSK